MRARTFDDVLEINRNGRSHEASGNENGVQVPLKEICVTDGEKIVGRSI